MGFLQIDIGETKNRAKKIEDLSVRVNNISDNKIEGICNNIPGVWKGDGSERYIKKLRKINSRVKKRGGNLKNISSALLSSANRLEKLEYYAASLWNR